MQKRKPQNPKAAPTKLLPAGYKGETSLFLNSLQEERNADWMRDLTDEKHMR